MKKISFILMFLLPAFVIAQYWSPIRVNQKMNYQHSDSAYISHTIWVDSAIVEGADSVFFTNRIVKDVPGNPEIVLRNQPQFFGKYLVKQQYGFYLIGDPYNYTIYAYGDLGESWSFTGTSGISAEVTSLFTESVFGVTDSVKVISLSDGNEIRLSKNFGILQFPDFENSGSFELVGIQDTEYGESVPGFWEMYDFEVGDVFQFSNYAYYIWGDGTTLLKYTIDSKTVSNNQISYTYHGIEHVTYFEPGGGGGTSSEFVDGELTFIDSTGHPANFYPNQLIRIPYSSAGYGTQRVFSKTIFGMDNTFLTYRKQFGVKEFSYGFYDTELYYELDSDSDTLNRFIQVVSDPCGVKGIGYGAHIGQIFRSDDCFEYAENDELIGVVLDGDTLGIIYPDSVLLTNVYSDKSFEKDPISIYPNPAIDNFLIIVNQPNSGNLLFELRNSLGQLVKQFEVNSVELRVSVANLEAGLYFYSVNNNSEIISQGKVVIR